MREHYLNILGLSENATEKEIKKAFHKKALIHHPDRNDNPNAHQEFIKICEAYEWLTSLKAYSKESYNKKEPFNKEVDDLEERLKRAREILKKRAQQEHVKELKTFKRFTKSFVFKTANWVYFFSLAMALIIVLDHFLPTNKVEGYLNDYYEIHNDGSRAEDFGLVNFYFNTEDGAYEFRRYNMQGNKPPIRKFSVYELNFTPILHSLKDIKYDTKTYGNAFSLHLVFYPIIILFLLPLYSLLYKFPNYETIIIMRINYFIPIILISLILLL